MKATKLQIGVIIYTKIGTNTSILADEFKFFNEFQAHNPDCEFVFIAVSEFTKKSILKNRDLLNFPQSMIMVNSKDELHKLDGLSGVFSYMSRNTFFGGNIDKACAKNYMISSYCTNELDIPLFVRTPDSEYPFQDYKVMADVRINHATPSTPKFIESNKNELAVMETRVNYDNVYFIANGSRKICDWVVDIAYNDLIPSYRVMTTEEISKRTLYVSDAILFNVWNYYDSYSYLPNESTINKFIFIGYLSGSVAKNRLKTLPKVFKDQTHEIPTDIIGPGASDLVIDRPDVTLMDKGVYGKDFFEMMNKYLAYIFIGKGNATNKYINKTVYDCISARCPVVVYSECDTTGIIFDDKEFYFSNEEELRVIYEKLQDPAIRLDWIERQHNEIKNKLETLMDPMFNFSDYCKPKEVEVKPEYRIQPLF
jgi:hypothetical protein